MLSVDSGSIPKDTVDDTNFKRPNPFEMIEMILLVWTGSLAPKFFIKFHHQNVTSQDVAQHHRTATTLLFTNKQNPGDPQLHPLLSGLLHSRVGFQIVFVSNETRRFHEFSDQIGRSGPSSLTWWSFFWEATDSLGTLNHWMSTFWKCTCHSVFVKFKIFVVFQSHHLILVIRIHHWSCHLTECFLCCTTAS